MRWHTECSLYSASTTVGSQWRSIILCTTLYDFQTYVFLRNSQEFWTTCLWSGWLIGSKTRHFALLPLPWTLSLPFWLLSPLVLAVSCTSARQARHPQTPLAVLSCLQGQLGDRGHMEVKKFEYETRKSWPGLKSTSTRCEECGHLFFTWGSSPPSVEWGGESIKVDITKAVSRSSSD